MFHHSTEHTSRPKDGDGTSLRNISDSPDGPVNIEQHIVLYFPFKLQLKFILLLLLLLLTYSGSYMDFILALSDHLFMLPPRRIFHPVVRIPE
jgi:hypothetical protein